jgi:GNAT superfamily N-acetyltransferase
VEQLKIFPNDEPSGTAVSEGTYADLRELMELARAFHTESPVYSGMPLDIEKVGGWIVMHIRDPDMGCWVARDADTNKLAGVMFGQVYEVFFGPTRIASEDSIYVMPEYRGGDAAAQLLTAFTHWGWEKGAQKAIVTASSGISRSRVHSFLTRTGFKEGATSFMLEF